MGEKSSPFPKCKTCGKNHKGTCADPDAGGYLSQKVGIIAHIDHRKTSLAAAVAKVIVDNPGAFDAGELSGGSSAVERNPSKVGVEGSTPSPRSKKPAGTAGRKRQKTASADAESAAARGPGAVNGAPKSKGGRPRVHPDRKAYKAEKERERRAKAKASTTT